MIGLDVLQEALDKLFSLSDPVAFHGSQWYEVGEHITELMNWREKQVELIKNVQEKFATFKAELELPVWEWLKKHTKTLKDLQCSNGHYQCKQECVLSDTECKEKYGQWVSVEEVRIFFAKEHPVRKRFQVRENQITLLLETDDKEEALKVWRESHRKQLDKFHEIYELRDGVYRGTNQFAPGDQVRW